MKQLLLLVIVTVLLASCRKEEILPIGEPGTFTDIRDGRTYRTVMLGTQTWFAENLRYDLKDTSSCFYYKADTLYQAYGFLYTWDAARIACPEGWQLPSDDDWKALEIFLGMEPSEADSTGWRSSGGVGIKIKKPNGWNDGGGGTNQAQMFVLPGGFRETDGSFLFEGDLANFWTATAGEVSNPWGRALIYYSAGIYRWKYPRKTGFSVRCIMK